MFAHAPIRHPLGLANRLLRAIGLHRPDPHPAATDRFAALDDPATRKALKDLPAHLLWDIGVSDSTPGHDCSQTPEGEALRKYLW